MKNNKYFLEEMDSKNKMSLTFNSNITRNLFPKTYSFSEKRKFYSNEKLQKSEEEMQKPKQIKSFIYFQKFPVIENKKDEDIILKPKLAIDSKTEGRLPKGYIDISYDNPINE